MAVWSGELPADEPLATTSWYQLLPASTRARLACHSTASKMKIGLEFESVLKRGLLEFASRLPNGSPEFRYAYHEVIEEAQHALMFQEFVNRSGFDARGLGRIDRIGARIVIGLARWFPELFFVFVLGGEDPIDHVQRRSLRRGGNHPLVERIMRIHATEEAHHLSFARHYLKRSVPNLPRWRRAALATWSPVVLAVMAEMMLQPSRQLVATYGIPAEVIEEAYTRNPAHRERSTSHRSRRTTPDGSARGESPSGRPYRSRRRAACRGRSALRTASRRSPCGAAAVSSDGSSHCRADGEAHRRRRCGQPLVPHRYDQLRVRHGQRARKVDRVSTTD